MNELVVLGYNSNEHVKKQQVEQHHKHNKVKRRELLVATGYERVVIEITSDHYEKAMSRLKDRRERVILETEQRIPPDGKPKQHDREHQKKEPCIC